MNNFYKVLEMVRNRLGCVGIGINSVPTKFGTHWTSRTDTRGWLQFVANLFQVWLQFGTNWGQCFFCHIKQYSCQIVFDMMHIYGLSVAGEYEAENMLQVHVMTKMNTNE